ncbi:MAG: hypothetical protein BHW37_00740 [Firmicutes bacterium CAG:272_52_7]|nr:MAG: hypothetical protein BHW37_00740 [Firmicutes bacterium CAG:272_52_7]
MVLFKPEVVFAVIVVCEIVVEEVYRNENTGHVADIEAGEKRHRQREHKEFELFFCYQPLDSKCDKRKKDEIIDPHRVVCHDDGI